MIQQCTSTEIVTARAVHGSDSLAAAPGGSTAPALELKCCLPFNLAAKCFIAITHFRANKNPPSGTLNANFASIQFQSNRTTYTKPHNSIYFPRRSSLTRMAELMSSIAKRWQIKSASSAGFQHLTISDEQRERYKFHYSSYEDPTPISITPSPKLMKRRNELRAIPPQWRTPTTSSILRHQHLLRS